FDTSKSSIFCESFQAPLKTESVAVKKFDNLHHQSDHLNSSIQNMYNHVNSLKRPAEHVANYCFDEILESVEDDDDEYEEYDEDDDNEEQDALFENNHDHHEFESEDDQEHRDQYNTNINEEEIMQYNQK
ncbi:hypothetical protein HK096_000364, partial [Nowakowskiella sp. JEL0078]